MKMASNVVSLCEKNPAAINSIAALADAYLRFKGIVDNISLISQSQMKITKGVTLDKNIRKEVLSEIIMKVANGLRSYAHVKNDVNLETEVGFSVSILKRMRNNFLLANGRIVQVRGNLYAFDLEDYGVDAALLAALGNKLDDYDERMTAPRRAIIDKKTATAMLKIRMAEMDDVMKNLMDKMVFLLADEHSEFKALYKLARRQHKFRTKKRKSHVKTGKGMLSGVVTNDVNFEPIEDAEVTVMETQKKIKTDEDGVFYDDDMKVSFCTLEIRAATYKTKIVKDVEIIADKETLVEVEMEAEI